MIHFISKYVSTHLQYVRFFNFKNCSILEYILTKYELILAGLASPILLRMVRIYTQFKCNNILCETKITAVWIGYLSWILIKKNILIGIIVEVHRVDIFEWILCTKIRYNNIPRALPSIKNCIQCD